MIYNQKNFFFRWIMHWYATTAVRRHFHELKVNPLSVDQDKSVLLIGNHFSFWDGLILYCVNYQQFKKKFHVMLLEETAKRSPFLKYAGAFSVAKNSRDIIKSLDYAAQLLQESGNMVLIYPQGKLYSNFISDVRFEQGIMRVIKKAGDHVQLIFAATFVESMNYKKATATVYLAKENQRFADKRISDLQQAYQQHYDSAKQQQTQIVL